MLQHKNLNKMNDSRSIEKAKSFFVSGLEKLNNNNLMGAEIDFESSLSLAPNRLSTMINLSIVLIKLNKFENAEKVINKGLLHHAKNKELLLGLVDIYKKLISLKPDYAEAHANLGNSYKELKMYDEALASYSHALFFNPNLAEIYSNKGIVFNELKKYQEALQEYDKAIAMKANLASAYSNRGITLSELNRLDEALSSYTRAIELNPYDSEAYSNRGITLNELKKFDEALADYDRAIELNPSFAEAYSNRGNTLKELNRLDDALASYDRAIQINPLFAEAYSYRGIALTEQKRIDEALASFDRVIEIKPDSAEAFYNRGVNLEQSQRYEHALSSYERAIEIDPNYASAHWNKSLILLKIGEFSKGLILYEWRWKVERLGLIKRTFLQPLWLGKEDLQYKTILLHAEQGFGDTIHFCRYAKLVKELGARVLLEVPKQLFNLLNKLEGVDELIESGKLLPDFHYHCPLLSLPLAFNTNLSNIPSQISYLENDPNKLMFWRSKLGEKKHLRIGVVWSSTSNFKADKNRSMQLQEFINCIPLDLYQVVSLQKEIKIADKDFFEILNGKISYYGADITDFADTAAIARCVDLVVSTCTSIPHMTAALGIPTWLLLSTQSDWRWFLDREYSPWYPSIKIYRQPRPGDWDSVIQRVRQDLIKYSNNSNQIE